MEEKKESSSLMHDFTSAETKPRSKSGAKQNPNSMKYLGVFIVIILLGVGSGYALAQMNGTSSKAPGAPTYSVSSGKTFGDVDTSEYKDIAEGKLAEGGIEGEGAFHLVRPGGDSQNVYLTSSTVDLTQFIGKDIKVWGKTQAAQTAGWLMDVGKVEVL